MEPEQVGDIELIGGTELLWVSMARPELVSHWRVEDVKAAVAYLEAWIKEQEG